MVSSFASQLQTLASKSSNELDLKAQRNAHAESLLFDKDVAIKQDFETIYSICIEGFRELCQLDSRFHEFDRNLFAEQAKTQDRQELNRAQNEALDLVVKRCLMLLGPRVLLKPALKALEWLVRRFRIHVHNVDDLLITLLPYHEVSVWANAVSIIPNEKVVGQWKVLRPYMGTTWNVPRHALAYAASHNDAFFASLNSYALILCRQQLSNTVYMTFWSSILVEAISSRLAQTRSGRKEVETQRIEDLLLKVLPLLSDGYEITGSPDLVTTCYTVTILLAARAELADHLLDSLLLAVCQSLQRIDSQVSPALITASVVVSFKQQMTMPKKVVEILLDVNDFDSHIRRISTQQSCRCFLIAVIQTVFSQVKRKNARKLASYALDVLHLIHDLYPADLVDSAMLPLASRLMELSTITDGTTEVQSEMIALAQKVNETSDLSNALSEAIVRSELDAAVLENLIGMTVNAPVSQVQDADNDTPMEDSPVAAEASDNSLESMPAVWNNGTSFLAADDSAEFHKTSQIFETVVLDTERREEFAELPIWSSTSDKRLLWQSFLLRFASSTTPFRGRQTALNLLTKDIKEQPSCNLQFFIPYALMLLTDVKSVRQSASNLLGALQDTLSRKSQDTSKEGLYSAASMQHFVVVPQKQVASLLADLVCPVLEECVLDPGHIVKVIQNALHAQSTAEVRKSHRQALFSLLTQHALASPLIRLKVVTISMLEKIQKIGGKSKTKLLLPMLQEWSILSSGKVNAKVQESGFSIEAVDAAFVQLTDVHDGQYLEELVHSAPLSGSTIRSGLLRALFEYMGREWHSWTADEHISSAEKLLSMAFSSNGPLSAGAQAVLRSVDLSSEVLATLLQISGTDTSEVKGPPSKKKRRSSSGASQSRIDVIRTIDDTASKISLVLELVDSNQPESKPELVTVMFEMLACLKQLQQNRIESPYLLNLCLSSLHAMINSPKARGKSADVSGIKPELVTECLRGSDNPQVQNSSLLVLAALSSVVPDRMVHNVMPIFTFIGHNMLSKDDEHSINVVNEAIDKIVPALLQSLRKGNNPQTYQTSMSTMLANFTSAYDHIPRHRRVAFYQKLLFSIETEEFGFILIALLAAQQGKMDSFAKFLEDVSSALSHTDQLIIYRKLVGLAVDVLSASPKVSTVVYNLSRTASTKEKLSYAKSSLAAGTVILQGPSLIAERRARTQTQTDHAQTEQVEEQLRISFQATLSAIKDLSGAQTEVQLLAKECLDALLQVPKMAELLAMLQVSLDDMEETQLRSQALRILSLQLQKKLQRDARTRELALSLVQKLNGYVNPRQNAALVQASLACVNAIAEAYGRKNPELISSIVENIVKHGLVAFKSHPKVLEAAILTTASVVEVVKEGSIPFISAIISQLLSVLQTPIDGPLSPSLFSAGCTLLSTILSNVSFIVSQDQLTQVLDTIFSTKQDTNMGEENTDLSLLFQSMTQKVELEILLGASTAVLGQADDQARIAPTLLHVIQQAIEASPKSTVIKQSEFISKLFETMLDTEASQSTDDQTEKTSEEPNGTLMGQMRETSIKFIYKINDTTFRPIFESWVEWATMPNVGETSSSIRTNRQIALFKLLIHFFDNLKAIVTSYASYLLPSISAILKSATTTNTSDKTHDVLLTTTLTLLEAIASHDQDAFFSAPSNFEPIAEPLVSTLRLAATKAKRSIVSSHIIPAVIALATATMDSPTTHGTLVHFVVGLKPHSSARVRLASIQTLLALTEDEDVGDEFLANTIGIGGGEGEGARGGGSSVGEIMVYVNEMLEDDDEDVEREVRKWVQLVRSKVGEDIFEV